MKTIILLTIGALSLTGCATSSYSNNQVAFQNVVSECGAKPVLARRDGLRFVRFARWKGCERDVVEETSLDQSGEVI